MPLIETKGAASAQGFGGAGAGASGPVTYIEDVFSTWLYTGNGSTQTITNGIDLSGKGGLVWFKKRSAVQNHALFDTARGGDKILESNNSGAQLTATSSNTFLSNGISIGPYNDSGSTYASWTFRKQPKFFDIVTYTGNGVANRQITHNLGSTPGCIIIKCLTTGYSWVVWHRSLPNGFYLSLDQTAAQTNNSNYFGSSNSFQTSTYFTVGSGTGEVNQIGDTYVAYLFAHDAGGFGLSGTDNVISCGSFTTDGSGNATVNLGYEPQWMMLKRSDGVGDWSIQDNMRLWTVGNSSGQNVSLLYPNQSAAENYGGTPSSDPKLTNTGFKVESYGAGRTYIYIAIRRGPMKVPTSGTSVYYTTDTNAEPAGSNRYVGFPADLQITGIPGGGNHFTYDRLRGVSTTSADGGADLRTNSTNAESTAQAGTRMWGNVYIQVPSYIAGIQAYFWNFRRAPSFFDEVCYTGDGVVGRQIAHNLGAVPELMIIKARNNSANWGVYYGDNTKYLYLQTTDAAATSSTLWNNTSPTTSVFTVGGASTVNVSSAYTYVAYLFATCAGVSKVGSYTGTGALQTIDCGFTAGARFVLIKRTDSTGDWYVYDSARGISSGNDPYLLLNSTAAEVTGTNYVDTTSVGFQVTAAAPAGLNANGGSFVFLAIA